MTTATLRPPRSPTTGVDTLRARERRGARLAGWSLVLVTMASVPAAAGLERADDPATRLAVGSVFALVAVLDVAVGLGLYALLRARAHSSAYAALVSRAGYAVLLAVSAARLLWPGGGGVGTFRADWSLALVVFGLHLVVTTVALKASRVVPALVAGATGLAGLAYLLDESLSRWTTLDGGTALVPFMLGELVLTAWLLRVGHRRPRGTAASAGTPRPAVLAAVPDRVSAS